VAAAHDEKLYLSGVYNDELQEIDDLKYILNKNKERHENFCYDIENPSPNYDFYKRLENLSFMDFSGVTDMHELNWKVGRDLIFFKCLNE